MQKVKIGDKSSLPYVNFGVHKDKIYYTLIRCI